MKNYIELSFNTGSEEQSSWLIAELNDAGFEGFEEGEQLLKAFIPEKKFDKETVDEIANRVGVNYNSRIIQETNWNQVWESSFEPVMVDNFAAVRADFHNPISGVEHEIVITPKMSFGTGHHATTYQMMATMREIDFHQRRVFDFGTGTGVLAILAEKMGAAEIIAVDIDEWSILNAKENLLSNQCTHIRLQQSDTARQETRFDVILANINKNIIVDNFSLLTSQLLPEGILLLSGLLGEDEPDILELAAAAGLRLIQKSEKHNWLCLKLSY